MEAVAAIRIDEDLAVAAALLFDRLHGGHRDAGILLAEVKLRRALRLLVGEVDDAAAVVADRRAQTGEPAGRQEGDGAAHAEADDADRAGALQFLDGGFGVTQ